MAENLRIGSAPTTSLNARPLRSLLTRFGGVRIARNGSAVSDSGEHPRSRKNRSCTSRQRPQRSPEVRITTEKDGRPAAQAVAPRADWAHLRLKKMTLVMASIFKTGES